MLTAGISDFLPRGVIETGIAAAALGSYASSLRISGARVHLAGIL